MRQADGIGASGGDFAAAVTAASTGVLTLIIWARLSCATKNNFPICLAKKAKTVKHTEHMHTAPTISRRAGGLAGLSPSGHVPEKSIHSRMLPAMDGPNTLQSGIALTCSTREKG